MKLLLTLGATLVCASWSAQSLAGETDRNQLARDIEACASEENPLQRLVCYDEIAEALGEDVSAAVASDTDPAEATEEAGAEGREQARERQAEAEEQRARRLAEAEERAAEAERRAAEAEQRLQERESRETRPREITDKTYVTIVDSWQNPRGLWRFELDNGEVWQQTTSDSRFRFDPEQTHYIEPGRLSNFFFSHDDTNRRLRVQRAD